MEATKCVDYLTNEEVPDGDHSSKFRDPLQDLKRFHLGHYGHLPDALLESNLLSSGSSVDLLNLLEAAWKEGGVDNLIRERKWGKFWRKYWQERSCAEHQESAALCMASDTQIQMKCIHCLYPYEQKVLRGKSTWLDGAALNSLLSDVLAAPKRTSSSSSSSSNSNPSRALSKCTACQHTEDFPTLEDESGHHEPLACCSAKAQQLSSAVAAMTTDLDVSGLVHSKRGVNNDSLGSCHCSTGSPGMDFTLSLDFSAVTEDAILSHKISEAEQQPLSLGLRAASRNARPGPATATETLCSLKLEKLEAMVLQPTGICRPFESKFGSGSPRMSTCSSEERCMDEGVIVSVTASPSSLHARESSPESGSNDGAILDGQMQGSSRTNGWCGKRKGPISLWRQDEGRGGPVWNGGLVRKPRSKMQTRKRKYYPGVLVDESIGKPPQRLVPEAQEERFASKDWCGDAARHSDLVHENDTRDADDEMQSSAADGSPEELEALEVLTGLRCITEDSLEAHPDQAADSGGEEARPDASVSMPATPAVVEGELETVDRPSTDQVPSHHCESTAEGEDGAAASVLASLATCNKSDAGDSLVKDANMSTRGSWKPVHTRVGLGLSGVHVHSRTSQAELPNLAVPEAPLSGDGGPLSVGSSYAPPRPGRYGARARSGPSCLCPTHAAEKNEPSTQVEAIDSLQRASAPTLSDASERLCESPLPSLLKPYSLRAARTHQSVHKSQKACGLFCNPREGMETGLIAGMTESCNGSSAPGDQEKQADLLPAVLESSCHAARTVGGWRRLSGRRSISPELVTSPEEQPEEHSHLEAACTWTAARVRGLDWDKSKRVRRMSPDAVAMVSPISVEAVLGENEPPLGRRALSSMGSSKHASGNASQETGFGRRSSGLERSAVDLPNASGTPGSGKTALGEEAGSPGAGGCARTSRPFCWDSRSRACNWKKLAAVFAASTAAQMHLKASGTFMPAFAVSSLAPGAPIVHRMTSMPLPMAMSLPSALHPFGFCVPGVRCMPELGQPLRTCSGGLEHRQVIPPKWHAPGKDVFLADPGSCGLLPRLQDASHPSKTAASAASPHATEISDSGAGERISPQCSATSELLHGSLPRLYSPAFAVMGPPVSNIFGRSSRLPSASPLANGAEAPPSASTTTMDFTP